MRADPSRLLPDRLLLREVQGPGELEQLEDLQFAVWGGSEREVFPKDALRAIQHVGGLVAGAFVDGQLIGLVSGFPTRDPQVQHSHMLAVHPDWRGAGVAQPLKAFQREWCLQRGIVRVEWTYDPLRALNAHFNIHRLGASAHEYIDDFYGEMGGINAGLPSDRLVATWDLRHVPARLPHPERAPGLNRPEDGSPLRVILAGQPVRVHIPSDLGGLLSRDPAQAQGWRQHTRTLFHRCLHSGYHVTDFLRGQAPSYVLTATS